LSVGRPNQTAIVAMVGSLVIEETNVTRTLARAVVTAALAAGVLAAVPAPAMAARSFRNCTAMHKVYPHGVGRPYAHDHTSGTPVTNFKRSRPLYRANNNLDRDKDGIACEAH